MEVPSLNIFPLLGPARKIKKLNIFKKLIENRNVKEVETNNFSTFKILRYGFFTSRNMKNQTFTTLLW